jgi:hypothetical protein
VRCMRCDGLKRRRECPKSIARRAKQRAPTEVRVARIGRAMEETTRELIGTHVASGARLMARQKQIIAELKERGVDATEAERTLGMLSACLRILEDEWLKLWKERK